MGFFSTFFFPLALLNLLVRISIFAKEIIENILLKSLLNSSCKGCRLTDGTLQAPFGKD